MSTLLFLLIRSLQIPRSLQSFMRSFAVLYGLCLYFMNFWAVDLLQIRYAVILAWFCPCFLGWLFSLRDINLTLGLLPSRRHVVWRDSVGVANIFHQSFLWLVRHTDEPPKGRNSCIWLQSHSVLSSFGVVLMSYRVNFHAVRSALQYSACRI